MFLYIYIYNIQIIANLKPLMMRIALNSRARGEKRWNSMEEFEGRKKGMLTTGEWCNPVRNMLHHVQQGLSGDLNLKPLVPNPHSTPFTHGATCCWLGCTIPPQSAFLSSSPQIILLHLPSSPLQRSGIQPSER